MGKLEGKVAVITGGSSGMGLATAKEFIDNGAKVVIFGRKQALLNVALHELGNNAHAVQGDVTTMDDLKRLFNETKSKFGSIDILYINVGQGVIVPISETDEALFDAQVGVNFKGSYFTLQQAIPFLSKGASVIITTSWLNQVGFSGSSLLSSSKAALRSLVRVAAAELAEKEIRVNAISPGPIGTAFWGKIGLPEDTLNAAAEAITNQTTLKRFGKAEEIAKSVLFLASDDSSYITGEELAVQGGITAV
ncbi:SDR family oxidoreductase [uncultured Croceitalea sp.]|uniref:SDR family oxidoreductase n=1 Tax=uncultured Croceitalea sp. TaxID=1798908 RepID=UPI00374F61C4